MLTKPRSFSTLFPTSQPSILLDSVPNFSTHFYFVSCRLHSWAHQRLLPISMWYPSTAHRSFDKTAHAHTITIVRICRSSYHWILQQPKCSPFSIVSLAWLAVWVLVDKKPCSLQIQVTHLWCGNPGGLMLKLTFGSLILKSRLMLLKNITIRNFIH